MINHLATCFPVLFLCLLRLMHVRGLCSSDFAGDQTYPYRFYQGSTLYETVRGDVTSSDRLLKCSPKSIVLIARHGSRHPGMEAENSYRTLDNLRAIINSTASATLCRHDLYKIQKWRNWYQASLDKNLAVTGVAEMENLSERFASAFPELFTNASLQRFISSDYQRTMESARVFKNESFDSDQPIRIEINNLLMRSWEYCKYYGKKARESKKIGNKVRRFLEGRRVRHIVQQIAKRLGIPQKKMNSTLAQTIHHEGCAREGWATGQDSSWCLALKKRDKQVFEYAKDMRDYFKYSDYRQSCHLKQFILSALRNASIQISRNESATNFFLFTHKPTVLHLLREMRLIEDDGPFRGRDFKSKLNRKFRISKLVPGSGNIAFVLHQCEDDRTKLQIFLNERLIQLPSFEPHQDGLWDLEASLTYFGFNDSDDCILEDICPFEA